MPTKVLIADDHAVLRLGIAQLLRGLRADSLLLEADSRLAMLRLVQDHPDPDLLLLDLGLPDGQGLRTVEEVLALRPLLPIAIVSSMADPALARQAMALGVVGYIPKTTHAPLMENALRLLLSGGCYWPRELAVGPARPVALLPALGKRRQEVLQGVCRGLSNKQIAARSSCGSSPSHPRARCSRAMRPGMAIGCRRPPLLDSSLTINPNSSLNVAMDSRGGAVALWSMLGEIYFSRYQPASGWGEPALLDDTASVPSLAMDASGRGFAVWGRQLPSLEYELMYARYR